MLVCRIYVNRRAFLEKKIEELEAYLSEVLSLQVKIRPWKKGEEFPVFLGNSYDFYEMSLFEHSCLLMYPKENIEVTPALARKHWEQVQKKWKGLCIYTQKTTSAYNRKRLIEHRVPFIIPGNQMYLPHLGIDLHEHFRKSYSQSVKSFSPATQAVTIYALLHGSREGLTPSELAQKLDYTLMTMTRSFDEFQAVNLGEVIRRGKERRWYFRGSKHQLWEQTKPFLRSPIKYRTWLTQKQPAIIAGLSALSHFSNLNEPFLPVCALSAAQWKVLKKSGIEEVPSSDGALFELEIWHYNPNLFAKDGIVDPFSLYLSLEKVKDERVEIALTNMMKKIE